MSRALSAILSTMLCLAGTAARAQEKPSVPAAAEPARSAAEPAPSTAEPAPSTAGAKLIAPPHAGEDPAAPDDADSPDSQVEVDRGAAELEAVRKAEEKAGLLPQAPGAGPRDSLTVGLDPHDPLARDLQSALGSSIDGSPLADPAPGAGGSVSLAELTGISEQELRAKYDIPVELNDAVVAYIRFFQTDSREHFSRWLSRSTKFLPMMRQILDKQGVPLDLVYLSMIESGFNAYAYSFAKAAGLWQFMVGTSRRYGLLTDFWVDERRDPLKATLAAAKYLKDLRQRFHGDWYLAWAGYNAGEGKVDRAIRNEKTTDFWRMMGKGRTLRAETKHYVPKLIAAALIAKHPGRFGFGDVVFEQPWDADEVEIPESTDLRVIAKAAGVDLEVIRQLNPELRRFCTPPGAWTVKLPRGTKDAFTAEFAKVSAEERLAFTEHKIEKGEPLGKIARAYGVTEAAILRTNGYKSARQIKVGKVLVIPMQQSKLGLLAGARLEDKRVPKAQGRALAPPAAEAVAGAVRGATYKVRSGDSLWTIAARFNTTVEALKRMNRLTGRRAHALQVGQTIAVKADEG